MAKNTIFYQPPLHNKHCHSHYNRRKTNMRHIHTSIVSRHLATRGTNKILRIPPPHISSSEEILPRLTRRTLAQLRYENPSSNHTYTKSTPNHIHHHYSPFATHTRHTPSLQLQPHTHHTVTPGFVDRPRWSDGAAGQMERYAGWWTKSGMIGLPPQTRVKGVGRQQQASSSVSLQLLRGGIWACMRCPCLCLCWVLG